MADEKPPGSLSAVATCNHNFEKADMPEYVDEDYDFDGIMKEFIAWCQETWPPPAPDLFGRLPPELRNSVYEYLVAANGTVIDNDNRRTISTPVGFLRTNKQYHKEYLSTCMALAIPRSQVMATIDLSWPYETPSRHALRLEIADQPLDQDCRQAILLIVIKLRPSGQDWDEYIHEQWEDDCISIGKSAFGIANFLTQHQKLRDLTLDVPIPPARSSYCWLAPDYHPFEDVVIGMRRVLQAGAKFPSLRQYRILLDNRLGLQADLRCDENGEKSWEQTFVATHPVSNRKYDTVQKGLLRLDIHWWRETVLDCSRMEIGNSDL